MNKNRGSMPLAAVMMLSGGLALTACNDMETQQHKVSNTRSRSRCSDIKSRTSQYH